MKQLCICFLKQKRVEQFEELLENKLLNKEKIMGFGHRVYMKKIDPRALMMKEALKQLSDIKGDDLLYRMCEAGEQINGTRKRTLPEFRLLCSSCLLDAWYSDSNIYTDLFRVENSRIMCTCH